MGTVALLVLDTHEFRWHRRNPCRVVAPRRYVDSLPQSPGRAGRFEPKRLVDIDRNGWTISSEIAGRIRL